MNEEALFGVCWIKSLCLCHTINNGISGRESTAWLRKETHLLKASALNTEYCKRFLLVLLLFCLKQFLLFSNAEGRTLSLRDISFSFWRFPFLYPGRYAKWGLSVPTGHCCIWKHRRRPERLAALTAGTVVCDPFFDGMWHSPWVKLECHQSEHRCQTPSVEFLLLSSDFSEAASFPGISVMKFIAVVGVSSLGGRNWNTAIFLLQAH